MSSASPATATVTVTTTARSLLPPPPGLRPPASPSGQRIALPWVVLVLLVTLAMLAKSRGQQAKPVFVSAIFLVLLCIGCAGGSSDTRQQRGTPPGTSTLTLTGTSGSVTRTTTITLTVN